MAKKQSIKAMVTAILKTAGTQQQRIQDVLIAAAGHYVDHGDTSEISRLYTESVSLRTIDSAQLRKYFAAATNTASNAETNTFNKKGKKKDPRKTVPEVLYTNWWEYEKAPIEPTKYDATKLMAAIKRGLKRGADDGTMQNSEEFIKDVEALIQRHNIDLTKVQLDLVD